MCDSLRMLQHTLMKHIQVTNQKPERGFQSSDSSVTAVLSNNGATLYRKRSILKWEGITINIDHTSLRFRRKCN